MLCSIIVEKKNNDSQEVKSKHYNDTFQSDPICSADVYQYVHSVTSKWAKSKPKPQNSKMSAGTKKNKWSSEEDFYLRQAILKFGVDNWKSVSLVVPGRTGKQCRERWLSHMCPTLVHSEWSLEEDLILMQKQKVIGNKWSFIANFLPGRSSTSVKNRWNYLIRRDIPAHSEEYEKIAKSLALFKNESMVKKDIIESPRKIEQIEQNYIEKLFDDNIFNEFSDHDIENDYSFYN